MNRSNLILPLLPFVTACAAGDIQSEKPNIVIIYADDMGYGDMSCQNPESKIQTPNLDKLAASGIRFTDGHSSSGVSSPSRYSLLTGNYHWRQVPDAISSYTNTMFRPGEMTMPRMLKGEGYQTVMIGKWHLGWDWDDVLNEKGRAHRNSVELSNDREIFGLDEFDWSNELGGGPCSIGFDYYYGHSEPFYPPYTWIENNSIVEEPTTLLDIEKAMEKIPEGNSELRRGVAIEGWDVTDDLPVTGTKSVEAINNADKSKPLFLYCALPAPHTPIAPAKEYYGRSGAGPFGDYVVQCDDVVGDVIAALEANDMMDNTIIFFSADNGPERYAYARIDNYDHNSTNSLRGLKRDMWEGGHRVPYIISWRGKIAPAVSDQTVSQIDLMATFANIVGAKLGEEAALDSHNLMPLLEGKDAPVRDITVHNTKSGIYSLRMGDWLYIDQHTGTHTFIKDVKDGYNKRYGYTEYTPKERDYLLFNLKEDKMQRYDIAAQHPDIVKKMQAILAQQRASKRTVEVGGE